MTKSINFDGDHGLLIADFKDIYIFNSGHLLVRILICLIFVLLLVLHSSFQSSTPYIVYPFSHLPYSFFSVSLPTQLYVQDLKRVNEASGIRNPLSDCECSSRE